MSTFEKYKEYAKKWSIENVDHRGCFICDRRIEPAQPCYGLMKSINTNYMNNSDSVTITVMFHASCFESAAGDEYSFRFEKSEVPSSINFKSQTVVAPVFKKANIKTWDPKMQSPYWDGVTDITKELEMYAENFITPDMIEDVGEK